MRTICTLTPKNTTGHIKLPEGAQVLRAFCEQDMLFISVLADFTQPGDEDRYFMAYCEGSLMPRSCRAFISYHAPYYIFEVYNDQHSLRRLWA